MPARHIWQQLLHTGKPSTAELVALGMEPIPFIQRNTYAGWIDPEEPPPTTWLDNFAAGVVAPYGWIVVDHEHWLQDTQANRLASADKFVTFYEGMKSRRPEISIGFYSYVPKRDFFRARTLPGHADYIAWQTENNDMAAMAAVVDGFFPSIYHFYNVAVNGVDANLGVEDYYRENIRECKRMRDTYGATDRPIYPYIWWRAHSHEGFLDMAAWEPMVEIALAQADGCILWGGFQEDWDPTQEWWPAFLARLPQLAVAGRSVRPTSAAGRWDG